MKNVLFLSTSNIVGGAEIVSKPWLENTIHSLITLTSIDDTSKKFFSDIKGYNIKKRYYSDIIENDNGIKGKMSFFIKNIKTASQINKIINNNEVKAIYANNTADFFPATLYKIIYNRNIKIISHIHDMIQIDTKRAKIIKFLNRDINMFITPSNAVKENLMDIGIPENKIKVVYNSVDNSKTIKKIEGLNKLVRDKIVLLFIGAYNERKNAIDFLKIVKALNSIDDKYIGILAGRIEDEEYYNKIINYSKVNNINSIFLDNLSRSEINYLYSIGNILILTSNQDPLPTVILEAMYNNVLVFSRNVDGVKEMIKDGESGYLYDYNENIHEIAKKLNRIIKSNNNDILKNAYIDIEMNFTNKTKIRLIDEIIDYLE
ncbi:MAG: glycosyltransferase family 4 protein [Romboutsia timonensis]|uniref:glycosyltransferase family 4 protein n=1 Tax=Romboutsia timonensis TaxID=1776391 RepID=UPI002A7487BE|nr:glycosyltransferase family 4 protein [Romboutsia timonensis]MDY2882892.1 glycosyltransferase family 4 protein [Romboutsia timonensis]